MTGIVPAASPLLPKGEANAKREGENTRLRHPPRTLYYSKVWG